MNIAKHDQVLRELNMYNDQMSTIHQSLFSDTNETIVSTKSIKNKYLQRYEYQRNV